MGSQCLKPENSISRDDLHRVTMSESGTPKIPYSPKTRRIKRQNLVSSLTEDFNCDQLKDLFSKEVPLENFEIIKVIGRGSFAKVYLVKKHDQVSQTFSFFAMKVIRKKLIVEKNHYNYTMRERKILMEIKHPFLVQLHYAFQTPERLFFILDYVNGGDLFYHLKKKVQFTEREAKIYGAEILLALNCLHEKGFIYRDLKTENILLDAQGHARLTDFGLVKDFDINQNDLHYTFCGTPQYLAPELLKKEGYNYLVDYWGLGILMYELATGKPPFNSTFPRIIADIVNTPFRPLRSFSKDFSNLLVGLLQKDPKKRLGCKDLGGIQAIKQHPFFSDIDWDLLYQKKYTPPILPKVKDFGSHNNVEGIFLTESIRNTPEIVTIEKLKGMHFEGFTYNEDSQHLKTQIDEYELGEERKSFKNDLSIASMPQPKIDQLGELHIV